MSVTLPTIGALGTSWWIEIFDDSNENRRHVIHDDCAAFLRNFEERYSRFKPASYISRLNAERTLTSPDPELITLLTFGCAQYKRTHGIFNIMVGSKLVESGYDATYSFTPSPSATPLQSPLAALRITTELITLEQGLVDLGGFGKGYAIDALAQLLKNKHQVSFFLINGGGDMYGTSNHGAPIEIYLEHPTTPNTYLATTTIWNQGFAASSLHKRAWESAGTTYTHIIDTTDSPRTNRPDATFIKATTACTADIFATVALIAQPEDMNDFAENEALGVASFTLTDNTLTHNQAFIDEVPK